MRTLITILFILPLQLFGQPSSLLSRPFEKAFNYSLSYGNRGGGSFYSVGYSLSNRYGLSNIEIGHRRMSVGLYMVNNEPFVFNAYSDDVYVGGNYVFRHKDIKRLVPTIGLGVDVRDYTKTMFRVSADYKLTYPFYASVSYVNMKNEHNLFCGIKLYLY